MSAPRVFLIDGSSQMYRAYHAMRGSGLTGPGGKSTHAVYIFVTMLRKLMTDHHPEFIAASFDLPGPTFRSEMATDYKANRAPMPPDLAEQIPWVHEACEALGVPILTSQRFEADDVIGTMAAKAVQAGFEVAIVTGDKDFFQLVHDGIKVYNPKEDGAWFDAEAVKDKFGVRPDQVVDVLALMGDTIDNIKGVPGIGEKGARDLIANYGSLEALLEHASEVNNKRYREGLLGHAEDARQSRELAKIRIDVPIDFDPNAVRHRGASRERCFELFTRLGFRSLVLEYAPTADTIGKDYAVVQSLDELRALAADVKQAGRCGLRILPDAPSAMRAAMVGISFSTAARQARYVPLAVAAADGDLFGTHADAGDRPSLDRDAALAVLTPVLEDEAVKKVGHDLKFDAIMLARHGIALRGLDTDVMIAGYLLEANYAHPLEDLAIEHLGYKALKDEDVCGRGAKALSFASIPVERALDYAGERADLALQLAGKLGALVTREDLQRVYDELERPLIPVLVDIERAGVRIDGQALAAQATRIDDELSQRAKKIYELSGEEFNINSPKKLSEILFDRLGMRTETIRRTTKTKAQSTAFEVLEELALTHELPKLILEWRGLQKLKGTYIDALPALVNPETGRVHTCFNQAVAATGRLSSSDPNLQNIPIRTEIGRDIRRAFVAESGHVLISADYSQIELRVLAHLAGEQALIDAFQNGEDIHDRTALKVFGSSSGLSAHELRRRAKIINYALLYGKQAFTLARDIGVPRQEAQAFIDAYFAGFPAVRKFIDDLLVQARETGVVKTMFGRRRLVPDLNNRNYQLRGEAERKAVNFPIQGTAADILKRAMIDVHAALQNVANGRARMILTVHDELLFETPKDAADETAATVRSLMENAVTLNVPLEVDVGVGENWKDAK